MGIDRSVENMSLLMASSSQITKAPVKRWVFLRMASSNPSISPMVEYSSDTGSSPGSQYNIDAFANTMQGWSPAANYPVGFSGVVHDTYNWYFYIYQVQEV